MYEKVHDRGNISGTCNIGGYLSAADAGSVNAGMVHQAQQTASVLTMRLSNAGKSLPAVKDMLQNLDQRLELEPEDARDWNLLGRYYEFLGHASANVNIPEEVVVAIDQSVLLRANAAVRVI